MQHDIIPDEDMRPECGNFESRESNSIHLNI